MSAAEQDSEPSRDEPTEWERGYDYGSAVGAGEIARLEAEIADLRVQLAGIKAAAIAYDATLSMKIDAVFRSHTHAVADYRLREATMALVQVARFPYVLVPKEREYTRQYWANQTVDKDGWENEGGAISRTEIALAMIRSVPLPELPPIVAEEPF